MTGRATETRELILIEEDGGKVLRRIPVSELTEAEVNQLERLLLARSGEGVVIRDTAANDRLVTSRASKIAGLVETA